MLIPKLNSKDVYRHGMLFLRWLDKSTLNMMYHHLCTDLLNDLLAGIKRIEENGTIEKLTAPCTPLSGLFRQRLTTWPDSAVQKRVCLFVGGGIFQCFIYPEGTDFSKDNIDVEIYCIYEIRR